MKEIVPLTDDEVLLGANIDHEFSWCAVFAGALVASAVILFLLTLGTGVGLSLFSVPQATANTARNALTGGSIYFFASLAFGFAVGGYIAGRLMGPQFERKVRRCFTLPRTDSSRGRWGW